MAADRRQVTEISRYGPFSTKIQTTQTLPVQTQPPTQLMSHEVHQFTQLLNHDSVEHVHVDTMVNDSDLEGSGDTVLLHDDDDGHADAQSGPLKGKDGLPLPIDDDCHANAQSDSSLDVKGGVTSSFKNWLRSNAVVEHRGTIDASPHLHRDLPDSDATTEEGDDVENIACLDADAESRPPCFDNTEGIEGAEVGEKLLLQPDLPGVVDGGNNTQDNLAPQETPEAALVADASGMKSSQSRPRSIASVRAASLRASGLRAASRSASMGSAGRDDAKFDSDSTIELAPGMREGELKNPLKVHGTEDALTNNATDFDPMQSSPKATLLFDDTSVRSPRMSTSRSESKKVSPEHASLHCTPLEQGNRDQHMDSDATIELNTNTIEDLSGFGSVPEKPKTSTDQPEDMLAPLELQRLRSQASVVSAKKLEQEVGANDLRLGVDVKVHPRQLSNQKARKLIFDCTETAPTTSTDKLADGGSNVVSKALETEHVNVVKKPTTVVHALARERQCSLLSGSRAVSTNLSYLESQEPGEDSQLNALSMVDKLAWLDATCMSDDVVTNPVPQDGSVKGHAGAKGLQSLAQAAQMKTVHDKLDVFDWEDSQVDEGVSPDTNQGTVNVTARKRQPEANKPMTARKKQVPSHERKTEYTSCRVEKKQAPSYERKTEYTLRMEKRGDEPASIEKEKSTPDVEKTKVPTVEPSSRSHEVNPHTFFTTRLRNRTKAEKSPLRKGRKSPRLKSDPRLKSEPRKRVGKKKQTGESGKDFEKGQQKGIDDMEDKIQQASPSMKSKPRKRVGKRKLSDDLGKDLEIEQQRGGDNNKERKLPQQSDSLSAKSKKELLKISEVRPGIQCNLGPAARTSQDDAAADMWIEAFASPKNKTPMGSSVEVIKFKKRSTLHEDSGQDSKKCRIMEPATVLSNRGHEDESKKKEIPMQEDRVKPGLKIQLDSNKSMVVDAATVSRHKGRRVSTRLSQGEDQNTQTNEDILMDKQLVNTRSELKKKLKKPRVADTSTLSQVKGRRISTRNSQGEHGDALKRGENLMEGDETESKSKTREDSKQSKSANVARMPPVKSREVGTRGNKVGHMAIFGQYENAMEGALPERGPKTRSKAQDKVVGSDAKDGSRAMNAFIKSSTTQGTGNLEDRPSVSRGAKQADYELEKPSSRAGRSEKKEKSLAKLSRDAQEIEADPCMVRSSGLSSASIPINGNEGAAAAGAPKGTKRRREAADASVPESKKATEDSVSQLKEDDTDKFSSQRKESIHLKIGDMSTSTTLRRTRSSMHDGGSQKNGTVDAEKEGVQNEGDHMTKDQTQQNHSDNFDAKEGLKKQVAKSATRTTKAIPWQNKKTSALELLENSKNFSSIDEGRRRKRESSCIRVLFSHSLTEDTIKHQKRILAKLGGHLATSASDCTHFVSNGFVRTQNMLMSMAAGKIVATPLWLESCGQAHYFVDEKNYILQDEKKERELGFSMVASLSAACRTPLLKGVKVLVCPNTVPEPAVLKAIVECAGGQVVDIKSWSSQLDAKKSEALLIIIANEKGIDFCRQFLDKGLKVYSEELLLHGIVTQTLDLSRNYLFAELKQRRGPRRAANIIA